MEWASYLSRGAQEAIYHMCDEAYFRKATEKNQIYFPPAYKADGFVHATADPKYLLEVGNHFYKSDAGNWICLKLNVSHFLEHLKYESPAPVGEKEAVEHGGTPKFPHVYCGITPFSVEAIYKIQRGSDGSFLSIENLVQ